MFTAIYRGPQVNLIGLRLRVTQLENGCFKGMLRGTPHIAPYECFEFIGNNKPTPTPIEPQTVLTPAIVESLRERPQPEVWPPSEHNESMLGETRIHRVVSRTLFPTNNNALSAEECMDEEYIAAPNAQSTNSGWGIPSSASNDYQSFSRYMQNVWLGASLSESRESDD